MENKIRNINENYGDVVEFSSVEEMATTIRACGYDLPEDGLKEDRDYEVIDTAIIREVLDDARIYEGLDYADARIVGADEFEKLTEYWAGCHQMTTASGIEYAEIGEDDDTAEIIILRK